MNPFYVSLPDYSTMADAAEAKTQARSAAAQVRDLQGQLDRALLGCAALWTIVQEKLGLTDEELIGRMNELDISDGKLDGKVRRPPASCPSCGRTVSQRFPKCMYCGQTIVYQPFA